MAALRGRIGAAGVSHRVVTAAPSRLQSAWSDDRAVAAALKSSSRRGPVVLHCRGPLAAGVGIEVRRRLPNVRVLFDARGLDAAEVRHRFETTTREAELPKSSSQHEAAIAAAIERAEALERRVTRQADAIAAVTHVLLGELEQRFTIGTSKRLVVPCCTDVARFAAAAGQRAAARKELGLSENDRVLCYAGSMVWYQRPEWLLRLAAEATRQRPDVRLLVLSQSPHVVREMAEKAEVPLDRVLSRSVSPAEVPRWLAAADAGLLLRDRSVINAVASPVKFAEYLAAGLPVVVSPRVGDASQLVAETGCGVVLDPEALDGDFRAAVANLLHDLLPSSPTGKTIDRRERCRSLAASHFAWPPHLERLRHLYRRLLARA